MKLSIKICDVSEHLSPNAQEYIKHYYETYKKKYATDSGLDLVIPDNIIFPPKQMTTIHLGVCCAPITEEQPHGYYMYPRSSISSTPLRLANSVGIIDYSYRGELMAKVDNISNEEFVIDTKKGYVKLFQICSPDLTPITFKLVDELDITDRNTDGFGSTK